MTHERDFDAVARAWLELGPDEAPDRVIQAVLQASEVTPQVRRAIRWPTWRSLDMNRLPLVAGAAAVLVVVIGAGILFTRGPSTTGGVAPSASPSAAPAATPSPSASSAAGSATPLPAALAVVWQGPPRQVPNFGTSTRTRLHFDPSSFFLSGDSYGDDNLQSIASISGPSTLQVVSQVTIGCAMGDVGDYHWSLSPKGKILTISVIQDACAARAAAIPGTWYTSTACKEDPGGCLGDLEAGTFQSQYVDPALSPGVAWGPAFGAITYTVPDGWSNSSDWPATFSLTPSADYATENQGGSVDGKKYQISVYAKPAATDPSCANTLLAVPTTIDALMAHVTSSKAFTSSAVSSTTIDGHAAKWVDLSLSSKWTAKCPGDPTPDASLLVQRDDPINGWGLGLGQTGRMRVILIDLGGGHVGLVALEADQPSRFSELTTSAMPIVESFKFK